MEPVYRYLESIGYDHPLHPPFTHMPTGLVIGALLFLIAAIISRRPDMRKTAWYCIVLALIFAIPTTLLGITDWQHYYSSAWSRPITVKIGLTAVLFIFLIAGTVLGARRGTGCPTLSLIYLLAALTVSALGFYGAQLVYAEKGSADAGVQQGEKLFAANCAGCHPNGGNIINPSLPVLNSPKMKDVKTFIEFNRNPVRPDGSKGTMPAFPKDRLSDEDLKQVYQYIADSPAAKQG